MQVGITFDKQLLTSRQHAHFQNLFLGHTDGVTKGCEITRTEDNVFIGKGFFVICGRFVEVTGTETVEMPNVISGQLYCRVIYEVDLTQENTESEFKQGYFTTLTSETGWPGLTQDDMDDEGTLYQMPFCQFIKSATSVSSFTDTRPIFDIESVWQTISDNNSEYKSEFDEFYEDEQTQIKQMVDDLKEMGFVLVSDARSTKYITLPASGWEGSSSPYTQEIAVEGMTEDNTFTPAVDYPDNCTRTQQKQINKAVGYIYDIESGFDVVTFKATEKPATDIPMVLKGVI